MAMRLHEIHPSVVHFPLTLLPASLALDAVGRLTGSRGLMSAARLLMPAAAVSGVVAGVAGLIAQESVHAEGEGHPALVTHRNLNLALVGLTAVLAGARMRKDQPAWGYLLAGAAGVVGMGYTAYLGGKLTYSHGVGVERSGGVRSESAEIRRGSVAHALVLAVRLVGRALLTVVRELRRGEIAPLLKRETSV